MKLIAALAVMCFFLLGSCAHPLEQVVDEHRQERIGAAYAGRPVTWGRGDGVGFESQSHVAGLTVEPGQ